MYSKYQDEDYVIVEGEFPILPNDHGPGDDGSKYHPQSQADRKGLDEHVHWPRSCGGTTMYTCACVCVCVCVSACMYVCACTCIRVL